jgi:hypothetical protein
VKSSTTLIYDVTIEPAGDRFRITWQDAEKNRNSFTNNLRGPMEEVLTRWEDLRHQPAIGQALFRFLDGDARHFSRALEGAFTGGKELQLNLHTCKKTADLPFELLAYQGEFLLLKHVHLVRRVSDRGIEKRVSSKNRPLRLLFMACSPKKKIIEEPNYNREEEAILRITEDLPVEVDVEESGSMGGLRRRLMHYYYDVIYLAGHAYIDGNGLPFFQMEDEFGGDNRVYLENLWDGALIDNPPRLVFLSGCRTGQGASFARFLVENYKVPAVLGWGRSVKDSQANHAGQIIFYELSRGRSILQAVQRARYEMLRTFREVSQPAWPLLRLYCDGTPLKAIVKKEQRAKPKPRLMTHVYLEYSRVKVLKEGFVGRRRQLQISLQALKEDMEKVGVLLLGAGGLGKTCLAGKICEGFPGVPVIVLQGKLDEISLGMALKKAFRNNGDKEGLQILARKMGMTEKLAALCAGSFKERSCILLLDGFQQNLEGSALGRPGHLQPEAAPLLYTLLCSLRHALKRTHLVITSRCPFILTHNQYRDLVQKRLQPVWLTSFNLSEQRKKIRQLKNIWKLEDLELRSLLREAGAGNPLLMEWLDDLTGQIPAKEKERLQAESENTREDFIRHLGIRELYGQAEETLKRFLKGLIIYDKLIPEAQIPQIEKETKTKDGKALLQEGMRLNLVEYDQAQNGYSLTPLLRDILK